MIFVTVGTQLAFPRLMRAVNNFAKNNKSMDFFAQIGPDSDIYDGMRCKDFMSSRDIDLAFGDSELVVAHAGMGSIITAGIKGKNIIIFPRDHSLGEHRNAHQFATAKYVSSLSHVRVAWNEIELFDLLEKMTIEKHSGKIMEPYAGKEFCDRLKNILS